MTASERRRAILTAARSEFARSGFHGASTARIAMATNCSEPTLYKHFPGKLALFVATITDATERLEQRLQLRLASMSPDSLAIDHFTAYVHELIHDPEFAELTAVRKFAVTLVDEPEIAAVLEQWIQRMHQQTGMILEAARRDGSIHPDVDSAYVAWMWLGITLVGAFRRATEGPEGFLDMERHAMRFFETLRGQGSNGDGWNVDGSRASERG